jgi:ribosomal peptide maturation radical SAM protein 1
VTARPDGDRRQSDVLLVSMPFGPVFSPSLGLSLLQACLSARGRPSRILYFAIDFAERLGQGLYSGIAAEGRPSIRELAGEWIFSAGLFPPDPERDGRYVDEVLRGGASWMDRSGAPPVSEALIGRILRARDQVEPFLDECLAAVVKARPRVLGFTSVFQQHLASLALARRVKDALPDTVVVMGGANCEDVMGAETVRRFPFVDAVVSGEGELVFPDLVERALEGRSLDGLPGVRTPAGVAAEFAAGRYPSAPAVQHMDSLPYPDYTDYFDRFARSRFDEDWQPGVFFESSRGCWWGERMHCTFCGLNGTGMAYRSKSAARARAELAFLSRRHAGSDVQVVDNILDLAYFNDLLPDLARDGLGLDLFYETKSNLRKDQVRLLRAAGIRTIQPGIENLSDSVLRLMRKGVTALQNIQLLKWCAELGVRPAWNVLWGFPGEDPAEYARMAEVVPLLSHLPAPTGASDIRMDRFSPNFFDAERLGFADVRPLAPYRYLYPGLTEEALANIAYYFSFRYRVPQDVTAYVQPLVRAVRAWRKQQGTSALFAVDVGESLWIWDLRPAARQTLSVLEGMDRALYLSCDATAERRALAAAHGLAPEAVEQRLVPLVERGLMLRDGGRYLALAITLGDYSPPPDVTFRFRETALALGVRRGGAIVVPRRGRSVSRATRPRGSRSRSRRPWTLTAAHFSSTAEGELVVHTSQIGAKAERFREEERRP